MTPLLGSLLFSAALLCGTAQAVAHTSAAPHVRIASGLIRGVFTDTGDLSVYRGIPFAAPPVGELRWREPQSVRSWSGVRDASAFAPACIQGESPFGASPPQSEDCLYLNIWTSAAPGAGPRPVMVWIFGGGFQWGSAANPRFDGARLARHGVVVVTLNYRVGALGFLAHPELNRESSHGTSGNYGLLDQIAALRWVRANIAGFGGDPRAVTIFGQSAGATSVSILQASPLARGLFQRAIGESTAEMDPAVGIVGRQTPMQAENAGLRYGAQLGASSLAALRALPASRFSQDPPLFWPLENDGYVLPGTVYDLFAAGRQNAVPLLIGSNSAEGSNLKIPWVKPQTPAEHAAFDSLYGDAANPQSYTDCVLWQMWTWARLQSNSQRGRIYFYWFDYSPPRAPGDDPQAPAGAFHGSEVAYVFGNLSGAAAQSDNDRRLSDTMAEYWVNFARSGDPNGPGLKIWPRFTPADAQVMAFSSESQVSKLPRRPALAWLDQYFERRRAAD